MAASSAFVSGTTFCLPGTDSARMKSSKPGAEKTKTPWIVSAPMLVTSIQVLAGAKSVAPPCTSLVLLPKFTRAVPFCRKIISSAPGCLLRSIFAPRQVLGREDQVRRAAIVPINFEHEWARHRVPDFGPFDGSPHSPLAFIFFEDERSCLGRLSLQRRWQNSTAANQKCTNTYHGNGRSHRRPPRNFNRRFASEWRNLLLLPATVKRLESCRTRNKCSGLPRGLTSYLPAHTMGIHP